MIFPQRPKNRFGEIESFSQPRATLRNVYTYRFRNGLPFRWTRNAYGIRVPLMPGGNVLRPVLTIPDAQLMLPVLETALEPPRETIPASHERENPSSTTLVLMPQFTSGRDVRLRIWLPDSWDSILFDPTYDVTAARSDVERWRRFFADEPGTEVHAA